MELVYLSMFAFLAGFVDSVAGGGGLIQTPALFLFLPGSLSTNVANVFGTNKLASICGTSIAMVQYSRRCTLNWRVLVPAALAALVFSFLGARAVAGLRKESLMPVVFWLLIAVTIYTYARKDFGDIHAPKWLAHHAILLGILTGAIIGFYDGFFGPGTGSFLMFIFISLFGFDFLSASASSKVINFATNLAAVSYFAWTGHILVKYAIPMAACNMLGGWIGSRLAIAKGNQFVRSLFLIMVCFMILKLGWDTYLK